MARFTLQGSATQLAGCYLVDNGQPNPTAVYQGDGPSISGMVTLLNALATLGSRRARCVATSNINTATNGLTAIDGVTPVAGDTVLLAAQSTASQNGLWTASSGAWTQDVDWTTGQVVSGLVVEVGEGTSWGLSTWKLTTSGAITVGSTSLAFYPKFHKGTSAAMSAGTITISNVWLLAGAVIMLTANTAGGTPGTLKAAAASRTAGAGNGSFILASSSGTDTSTADYCIINW